MKWPTVALVEVAESIDYGLTASSIREPLGPKFLRITDIQDDRVDWNSVPYCATSGRSAKANALVSGDIVFARTGATTGKSFLIRHCPKDAVFASYLIRVRPSRRILPEYLAQFFRTQDYWAQIRSSARGAAQPGVNSSLLAKLCVPLPPLDEQRRIAAILDQADALRRKRQGAREYLRRVRRSLYVQRFVAHHQSYPLVALSELGRVVTGYTPSTTKAGMFGGSIPFLTPGDLDNIGAPKRTLTHDGAIRTVRGGAALVCCIGSIGKMGIAVVRSAFNQQINAVEWGERVEDHYGFDTLALFKNEMQRRASSTTLPILKKSSFETIEIPVAPLDAQRVYSDEVAHLDAMANQMRAYEDRLDALLTSLQDRAFNGELTDQHAARDLAAVG